MLKYSIRLALIILFHLSTYTFPIFTQNPTEKIFFVTGEASGEKIGSWYLKYLKEKNPNIYCQAIGGKNLEKEGAILYDDYKKLTLDFVEFWQFITHLPDRWKTCNKIANHIISNNFNKVVLVDCPLTNFLLMRKLKKQKPEIHITYIAPPEMWIWGKWKMDWLLKKYSDRIIVIYPFEQEWYKNQTLEVEWLGWPGYEEIKPYLKKDIKKEKCIVLCPGSRPSELETMIPILAEFVKDFSQKYPDVSFLMPVAQSFSIDSIKTLLKKYNLENKIALISGNENNYEKISSCCLAITKPGTITLVLALLKIPMIITYKVPWLTYFLARLVIQVHYIGLPNLFLNKEICKELIQTDCTKEEISNHAEKLYQIFLNNSFLYQQKLKQL